MGAPFFARLATWQKAIHAAQSSKRDLNWDYRDRSPSARISDTPTNPAPSDFEVFVRKGISDIRSMLSNFEEALAFQDARTTELEKKITPLEKKVNDLEARILTHESRLQMAELAENKLERFSLRNNFRIVGVHYYPNN